MIGSTQRSIEMISYIKNKTALVSDWIGIGRSSEFAVSVLKKWYCYIPTFYLKKDIFQVVSLEGFKGHTVGFIRNTYLQMNGWI